MKYTSYYLRLLWHWIATAIAYTSRVIGRLPFSPNIFKEVWTSYAVGAGDDFIKQKKFESAYTILKSIEEYEIDDVWVGSAQYMLATLYRDGSGVDKNDEKAHSLFQRAASAGNSDAISYMRRQNAIIRGASHNLPE